MGKSRRLPILQSLRLKIKSGFLKEEPAHYTFMKRYPPMNDDANAILRKPRYIDTSKLSNLYTRAVERNSLYADEKVYPAYWMHEPQAFTLAKKQYEHIQAGLSEEEAYKKAIAYVDEMEDQSYTELKQLVETLSKANARVPFAADPKISVKISFWREKLARTPYSTLSLAAQGEIDFIIQTDVLKWNEVERERRMRDPVFFAQFEKLRESIFPEAFAASSKKAQQRKQLKEKFFQLHGIDHTQVKASKPFFYEDYQQFFEKILKHGAPFNWQERDREAFMTWLYDTTIFSGWASKQDEHDVRSNLSLLRAHFFPMARFTGYPEGTFVLPSVQDFKQLLYDNDIGYKVVDGKLFVRRFYMIPQLLFPQEVLSGRHMPASRTASPAALADDIRATTLSSRNLAEMQSKINRSVPDLKPMPSIQGSVLDNLFVHKDGDRDVEASVPLTQKPAPTIVPPSTSEDDFDYDHTAPSVLDTAESKRKAIAVEAAEEKSSLVGTPEWQRLLEENDIRMPTTELERERDELFRKQDAFQLEESQDDLDLYQFRRMRQENMLLVRARLYAIYEEKEAARRWREWKARGVWMDLPRADIELLPAAEAKLLQQAYRESEGQITNSTQRF